MSTTRTALFARVQPGGVFTVEDLPDHPGAVFFVDSTCATGADSVGAGKSPDIPFLTLAYALSSDVCTADKGDTIYVMPGHTETCIAAGTITADIAGVKIVGLGEGSDRPTFSFTTAVTASFLVSGDNITVENCIFDLTGIDSLNNGINVTGAGCAFRNCEIEHADATGQADYAIVTEATADDLVVENCYIFGSGDAGTTAAIHLVGGDSAKIINNVILGAYTTTAGGILNDTTAATNLLIENNRIDNRTAVSTKAIVVDGATTGMIRGNSLSILSGSDPITAAAMVWGGGNTYTNAVATEAAGMTNVDSALNYIGVDDNNNAVSTSNVAANIDGSILERLEYIQQSTGIGTRTAFSGNLGIIGALGTDGTTVTDAATSVLGAIGANNANNAFASNTVVANADGSVLERLEYVQQNIVSGQGFIGTCDTGMVASTTAIVCADLAGFGNDYFNTKYYMQVVLNSNSAGNAPETQVRQITNYVSATGTFTTDAFGANVEEADEILVIHESLVAIGRDDNDNTIATTNVAGNDDGSVLERLEYVQRLVDNIDTATLPAAPAAGSLASFVASGGTALGTPLADSCSLLDALGTDGATVTDAAVTVLGAIGANNANNAFDSSTVVADDDGSVLERLEYIQSHTIAMERSIAKTDGAVLAGTDALFTIAGGPIVVTEFVGIVTTVIGGAANCHIDITTTTPAATTALSTDVAIDADDPGTSYTFTVADPGVLTPTTDGAIDNLAAMRWMCPIGTIGAHCSAAQSGVISWFMSYKPLSPLSVVTAA